MTLASFTALGILGAFILPGYITRSLVSRRVVLPQIDTLSLLLQSITISFALDMVVLIIWLLLASAWPSEFPLFHMLVSLETRRVPELISNIWTVVLALVFVFALGIGLGVWRNRFTDYIIQQIMTIGGPMRATPLLYFLLSELPQFPDSEPWVRVTTVDGSRFTGRVYQYGVYAPDTHDLVLEKARITAADGTERLAEGLVHLPGTAIVSTVIAYSTTKGGKLVTPWDKEPDAATRLIQALAKEVVPSSLRSDTDATTTDP